jgi:hypothetical protein
MYLSHFEVGARMDQSIVITDPDDIQRCRLLAIRQALGLEVVGLIGRVNVCAYVRREWKIRKKKRIDVYFEFCRRAGVCPSHGIMQKFPKAHKAYMEAMRSDQAREGDA